jgi:ATP-binding cassette subfamily A (ABC1) protein 3
MEEADVLSDRIAIMNHGQLRCCGSPSFLKTNLGQGFRLSIGKSDHFEEDAFIKLISAYVYNYVIETNVATELSIGFSVKNNGYLVDMLNEMEKYKDVIGIENYGISTTTIEEVFLK